MKRITFSKDAVKTLRRIPVNMSHAIRSKITQYAADPKSLANNVTELKGRQGVFRLRTGDWRVLFTDDGMTVAIIKVGPRGQVYD